MRFISVRCIPPELEIKDTTESNTSAFFLDLLLSIDRDGQLRTSLYDKRDDFNFHITNFPFLSSNIPSSPAYGVFISQLIRYARACSSYECFILRAIRLSNKLRGQGYVKERLKSSLRKFYGRYGDLTKQYEVPLSRMLHDILDDDHIQWHPPLIGHYTKFWPLLIWTLLPNLTFYLIVQGFHRTYATGAACQQRTLTPPDTWSCPTLGLACVLMSRPISPGLVLSPDFWISNIPRYFSFAFYHSYLCSLASRDGFSWDHSFLNLSCLRTFWVSNIPRYFYFASSVFTFGYIGVLQGHLLIVTHFYIFLTVFLVLFSLQAIFFVICCLVVFFHILLQLFALTRKSMVFVSQ